MDNQELLRQLLEAINKQTETIARVFDEASVPLSSHFNPDSIYHKIDYVCERLDEIISYDKLHIASSTY